MSTSELRVQGCSTVPVDRGPLETLDTEKIWQLEQKFSELDLRIPFTPFITVHSLVYRFQSTYCIEQQLQSCTGRNANKTSLSTIKGYMTVNMIWKDNYMVALVDFWLSWSHSFSVEGEKMLSITYTFKVKKVQKSSKYWFYIDFPLLHSVGDAPKW